MIDWYRAELARRQEPVAGLEFCARFLSASPEERAEIGRSWDANLEWALPNPWRLACADEMPGSVLERIRTDLLFQALAYRTVEFREATMGLAVVYNSCKLANIDPIPIFFEISRAVGGSAADGITSFATRDVVDQSMDAFKLTAIENPRGGYEIRPDW